LAAPHPVFSTLDLVAPPSRGEIRQQGDDSEQSGKSRFYNYLHDLQLPANYKYNNKANAL
jgi:hypothetical protein